MLVGTVCSMECMQEVCVGGGAGLLPLTLVAYPATAELGGCDTPQCDWIRAPLCGTSWGLRVLLNQGDSGRHINGRQCAPRVQVLHHTGPRPLSSLDV